jgi:hypothetical protein
MPFVTALIGFNLNKTCKNIKIRIAENKKKQKVDK